MLFPRNGRRRGGRWLAALAARGRVDGIGPGVASPGMGLAGARLLDALERRERREPSSCPPGRSMLWMSGWGSSLPPEFSASPAGARDRNRSLRPARPGRGGGAVLVVGLLLLGAAAAEAQTVRTLVSNAAQTGDDSANTSGNDHAQLFHTGGNAGGYTLTSVVVNSDDLEDDDFDVEVCEEDGTANEFPSTTASDCTALTAPASFVGVGNLTFRHTGLALSANTNYVVVITQIGTGSVELDSTTSSGEDSLGLSDWSIKNKFYWKSGTTWMEKSGSNEALSIVVFGYEQAAVDTTPPVLLSATVDDGGDEIALVFDELMEFNAARNLPHARFSVTVDGSAATFSQYQTTPALADFTQFNLDELVPDIRSGQTVIVTYTDPAGDDVSPMAFQDLAGNDVASFTTGAGGVPAVINNLPPPPPDVSSVALTSAPGTDNTYAIGDAVEATVTFSAAVDITGTPQLELDFAGTAKPTTCTTATNTTTMACSYEVVVGDAAAGGVAIAANKLTGGTITATGSTTITADLTHVAVAIDAGHKVDGIRPTLVTTGTDAPRTSTDGTQVILTFSEDISAVDRTKITIGIGGGNVASTSAANIGADTTTVELTLSTFIDANVMLTVALALDAVEDTATNGNLALAATTVTNAIIPNAAPDFSPTTATRSVPENTAANTNIGTALPAATDADNDPLTYTLEGADAASFGFDAATRQLSTASGVTYDHETQPSYSVTLKADDGNGGTDTIAVTITLTNVSEPPGRPAAPSVTATAGTTDSLDVNWTAPSNTGPAIDNYDLRYRQGSNGSWTNGPQNVSGTSATIGSLTEGASYQVRVLATNAEGDSPWSPSGSGQTGALGAPDVPHSLDATRGNRQVMLSWVQPSGGAEVTDYEYELDFSGTWISTGSTDTDYTVRNLTNGQPYTFRVRAANSAGRSAASAASASVIPATVPGATTNIGVTGGNQEVELNWTAPASNGGESITGYEYEQSGSGAWISTGGTDTDYTVFNLTNGQPYRFRVRALNSVGEGAASAASPNVTPATEPDAPTNLGATVSDQQVVLIWTAPASNGGATILRYEYELDFSGTWISTGGTAASYTVPGLTNGQSYDFRVRAVNRVGAGQESFSEFATPTATLVAPDAPFGLSATPGNQQVRLDWVQPSGGAALTHYEYELDGSETWISTGSTATSHTVMGLNNGQTYTFRVRALNSAGASGASGSRTATPTTTEPEAPESLSFTPGDGQVTLRWRAPANDGGDTILRYEYELDFSGDWISTGSAATSHTVMGLDNGQTYIFRVRAVNAQGNGAVVTLEATPSPSTGGGDGGGGTGGGGDDEPREPQPHAPRNLLVEGGDGQVTLTWDAPEDDGGSAITDYEYRIDGKGEWISIGSTDTTHTVTGLVNGQVYVFQVRAVNRNRKGRASNRVEATPRMPLALDFAHFANGADITSDLVFVNLSTQPTQPTLYFYDQEGQLMEPEAVVDVTGDLMVTEDGSLTVQTAMEPLGELTITTHGRGDLVSGSVKVVADGPIGGLVRYSVPGVGVAGVGASKPVRDVLFSARRQAGGIRTAAAIHNLEAEAMGVSCRLMSAGVALEEVAIPLEANGQTSWFIDDVFTGTDTSDFSGSVRCTAPGAGRFTAIAVEMDAGGGIFTTLPVVEVNRGRAEATTLDFAHFANGTWTTDLVFVNLETRQSGPPLSPFHTAIPPTRPAIYFYDTEGNPIAAASVVDVTGDLEVTEDGALTVRTDMEPLGVLTITTHGRGDLVSGSVRVVSEGPIGGMLRFDHPDLGVAGVGASPPVSDAIFPVRRQEGGITTGVALHNLEASPELVRCELRKEGVLLDDETIPLAANGQTAWFIDAAFPGTDTSDFSGSVRCTATGEGLFSAVALELDPGNRIFTTLPVVPVPERMPPE